MRIWWLNLLPSGGAALEPGETHAGRAQNFCRERSVLGMGWSVKATDGAVLSWNDYNARREALRKEHGHFDSGGNVNRWREEVSIGDLVWTKAEGDLYWLARITGDWHYDSSVDAERVDIVNQRPAMIVELGHLDDVPPKVAKAWGHTLEQRGEVDLPSGMNEVAKAAARHGDLLPENLADYCALWQPLRGTNSR